MKALLPKEFSDRLEPHLTGDRIVNLFLDNLQRYRTGQPLRNVVDKATGY